MADHNTRSKAANERLEEAVLRLTQQQTILSSTQDELALKLDTILEHIQTLAIASPPSPHDQPPPPPPRPHPPNHRPHIKLEEPRFDGQDAMGWIFKISQFFDYQRTPDEERITVASFYMDGPALSWFQWMFRNGLITSWQALLQALESRFAPSYYDDPKGALFKLIQQGSVNDYLTEFERLANRIVGLPQSFLLSCFTLVYPPKSAERSKLCNPFP